MSRTILIYGIAALLYILNGNAATAQNVETSPSPPPQAKKNETKEWKNIIRYNLSGALLFGIDHYIVLGYERVIGTHQSISVNIGRAALPSLLSFTTDSLSVSKDKKNTGFNVSIDYRFYLAKENKYNAPHGLYIGPYFSYNKFKRENDWQYEQQGATTKFVTTNLNFDIYTIGGELGYQFIIWKRLALDFVLIGPGISNYHLTATHTGELTPEQQQKLQDGLKQIITQKFPGMNYVFANKQLDANGSVGTWNLGYRYLIHIGFAF
jgi:hypothetical protein